MCRQWASWDCCQGRLGAPTAAQAPAPAAGAPVPCLPATGPGAPHARGGGSTDSLMLCFDSDEEKRHWKRQRHWPGQPGNSSGQGTFRSGRCSNTDDNT